MIEKATGFNLTIMKSSRIIGKLFAKKTAEEIIF
jgi:hypothetical protein